MKLVRNATAAAVLAATLLIPTQSAANGNELAKIVAGAVALGVIAVAIDRQNDRRDEAARASNVPEVRLGRSRDADNSALPYLKNRQNYIERDQRAKRQGYKKARLPERCLRTIVTNRGERKAYSARCLNQTYKHARHLPQSCEIDVRTNRGFRPFYPARCLRRDGWRVASR